MVVMIRCACLISVQNEKILLVRTKDQPQFCLPGGKIELGETEVAALIRELKEELSISIIPSTIKPLFTFVGKAYMQEHLQVELNCFSAQWNGKIMPATEIFAAEYISLYDEQKIAPTLIALIQQYRNQLKALC